jgi:hypothetical protein
MDLTPSSSSSPAPDGKPANLRDLHGILRLWHRYDPMAAVRTLPPFRPSARIRSCDRYELVLEFHRGIDVPAAHGVDFPRLDLCRVRRRLRPWIGRNMVCLS